MQAPNRTVVRGLKLDQVLSQRKKHWSNVQDRLVLVYCSSVHRKSH